MAMWQIQYLHSVPMQHGAIHFSDPPYGRGLRPACGTFGYICLLSEEREKVTCVRCRHKLKLAENKQTEHV
jgi:hypothetical protein